MLRRTFGDDPFPVAAALALGATEGQLRAAVGAGALERLRPGVLCLPLADGQDEVRRRALAALVSLEPAAVVSHTTAAHLHRLPARRPGERPGHVRVTLPQRGRVRAGLHVHAGLVTPPDTAVVDGVRCTSVERTALDLARRRPLVESLVVLDAALARSDRAALADAAGRLPGVAGLARLRRAIELADARAESPLESASRGLVLDAGLPAPELQAWLADDEGRAWRVDFLWRALGVVGEADGWGKYAGPADLRAEKLREDALRRTGWTVVRWTSDEVWRTPAVLARRLRGHLL